MYTHAWKRLENFPLAFVVTFAIGIFVPFMIALSYGHVTAYVPYISEGGGLYPEAGVFSCIVILSTILSQWIICIRYLVVEQLISNNINDSSNFYNKMSFGLGVLSTIAMILVTSFPTTTLSQVHNSAAGSACVCYVMYIICQTWLSFKILGKTKLSFWRLAITICTVVGLVLLTVFGFLGSSKWTASYWTGSKRPSDEGFVYYVISAAAEWSMAIFLMIYFSTFISEFRKSTFSFKLEIIDNKQTQPPSLSNLDIRQQ